MEKTFVEPCTSEELSLECQSQFHIETQIFDQIFTISRIIPGPRVSGVSLLGFQMGGVPFMLLLVVALVLPGMILIPVFSTLYFKLSHIRFIQYFKDGAVLAIIAILLSFLFSLLGRGLKLNQEYYQVELFFVIAFGVFFINRKYRINPGALVLLGAILGFLFL